MAAYTTAYITVGLRVGGISVTLH